MGVHNLNNRAAFETEIRQGKGISLLDCFATWCGPCKSIAPIIVELSKKYPSVKFYKLDVDEVLDVAEEFELGAIPTFFLFRDGQVVDTVIGANPGMIQKMLDRETTTPSPAAAATAANAATGATPKTATANEGVRSATTSTEEDDEDDEQDEGGAIPSAQQAPAPEKAGVDSVVEGARRLAPGEIVDHRVVVEQGQQPVQEQIVVGK